MYHPTHPRVTPPSCVGKGSSWWAAPLKQSQHDGLENKQIPTAMADKFQRRWWKTNPTAMEHPPERELNNPPKKCVAGVYVCLSTNYAPACQACPPPEEIKAWPCIGSRAASQAPSHYINTSTHTHTSRITHISDITRHTSRHDTRSTHQHQFSHHQASGKNSRPTHSCP